MDEILMSPDNNLWLRADEPIMFLACALELKGYYKNPNGFISRLPILVDATCNGLQHLSAMACDIQLANRVNIAQSNNDDDIRDIYSELIPNIDKKIKDLITKDNNYINLSDLKVNRKLIKRGIMTITYGVTKKGILDQLLSDQFYLFSLLNNKYIYRSKYDYNGDVNLTLKDL
ncbi:hypothetical protein GGS23DRAFT_591679 [Durotheca rogersii]|uniref:uncharacterized protein n=1 Tax=Durotheca rogersii TaxID=419775 RepID=UPI00221FE169|nr:uncharacterized protein GGS23DRAFT_591679 [Durotheca rogersii]KAI5848986.1 hypothetical protein GGS23DRAFT_591679 [Durotheca rogersii]